MSRTIDEFVAFTERLLDDNREIEERRGRILLAILKAVQKETSGLTCEIKPSCRIDDGIDPRFWCTSCRLRAAIEAEIGKG